MKKLLFLVAITFTFISFQSLTFHPDSNKAKPVLKTIIIDPGHGGKDQGAQGLFSTEAQVALAVSLTLGKEIQKEFPDIKLVFTRTTDVLPGNTFNKDQALRVRANMANEARGDLFVSIHCNAVRKAGGWYEKRIVGSRPKVVYIGKGKRRKKKVINEPIYESYYVENKTKGTESYIWAADRSGAKSSFISADDEGENGETVEDSLNILDLNSPEAKIRAQLYTKFYFRNSYTFAKYVEDEFQKAGRVSRGGVKQRNDKGIWVLQATGMPSVLIEIGFITNKEEEEYLNSEEGQQEVVSNIMEALRKYKKDIESSKGTPVAVTTVPTNG